MMRSEVIEAGKLVNLWNEWGLQILVIASFGLQVFLLVFGGVRRHSNSTALTFFLWSAYLLADSTAIYTLGHLSVDSMSDEHQLVAFWAPFLLLHLGGPDNITAYALEDNALWLRHLQTLAVQVLGAAYVIYEYIASRGALLFLASLSMFFAGLLKYGERIWALKCGNISSIRSSISIRKIKTDPYQLLTLGTSEEDLLLGAHSQFDICKGVFADIIMLPNPLVRSQPKPRSVISYLGEDLYKLVEMELSLMYDFLYTKAAVIHTWYGFCIHFISLFGTATTFLLFQLSISNSGNRYSRVDVAISYVLLVGALVLEIISVCRAVLSTWTCSLLHRRGRGWEWSLHIVTSLGQRVHPASRRLWSGSIGQYNLFHLCTRNTNEIGSRLATKLGLEDWWNKMHFSGTFPHANSSLSIQDIKKLVLQALRSKEQALQHQDTDLNSRGSFILKRMEAYKDFARWSVNIDFDESILVWHIATEVFIRKSKARHAKELLEATEGSVKAPNPHGDSIRDSANMYAILLANELLSIELQWQDQRDTLELILGVWVEMSLYAADHCSQESHARQLSNGCEFITIVSLLAHHFKYYSGAFRGADNLGEDKPASENKPVTVNNPMSENCGNLV
ncbi:putative protein of unknown function (DUF594) domain family protein isoform X4 [Zea mays]|uniref:OSJNBa0089E12.13-like protein n=1 Tax=Zea mays TaxID=4577 RepID=A0A1D6J2V9_MAIZE|nr:putative protein of unknown function (DUF594) domain family protein isoform X4 [Zea mays]AQK42372.1 OSJNBa0089E12.13-like protein [Zea mays]|eukprot:XP_008662203.1 putative protein of unknown function (DUF594) domain family protein isoform X4 [Zea mays]